MHQGPPSTQSPVSPAAAAAATAAPNLLYPRLLLLLLQSAATAAAGAAAALADAAARPPNMHQLFPGLGVLGTKPGGKGSGATANEDGCHPRTSRTKPGGDTRPEGEGPVAKAPRLGRKPRGAMVAAVGRSGETVGLGHDGVTEDAAEPRFTSGR